MTSPGSWPDPVPVAFLAPDGLAPGRWHALALELATDARGAAVRAPVLVARGAAPGPTLAVVAALHGDELNGAAAIHALVETLPAERVARGALVAVPVANVPGFLGQRRLYDDRTDLNHVMPGDPEGDEAARYAHAVFARVAAGADLLCDLHTASRGRRNALYVRADLRDPRCARMAHLCGAAIVLHHEATPTTLRGAAAAAGIAAVTVEIGDPQVWQAEPARAAAEGLLRIAVDAGIADVAPPAGPGAPPATCAAARWLYAPVGGLLTVHPAVGDRVSAGEEVARLVDAYGRPLAAVRAPESGVVIGRSANPVGPSGARVLHLGLPATGGEGFDAGVTPLAARWPAGAS